MPDEEKKVRDEETVVTGYLEYETRQKLEGQNQSEVIKVCQTL